MLYFAGASAFDVVIEVDRRILSEGAKRARLYRSDNETIVTTTTTTFIHKTITVAATSRFCENFTAILRQVAFFIRFCIYVAK
jgi:hypothetical protein